MTARERITSVRPGLGTRQLGRLLLCAGLALALAACADDGGPIGTEPAPSPTGAPTAGPTPRPTPGQTPAPTAAPTGTPAPTATPSSPRCASPTDTACCGNGRREGDEACDDANSSDGDGCLADCTTACPNGLVDPNEGCATLAGGACDELPESCGPADLACTMDVAALRRTVDFLADDAQEGRDNGSEGSRRAREFLARELATFAFPGAADGTFFQPLVADRGTNVLARLPGRDPSTSEVVVLGAHYDHLGAGAIVFNGATDNAAGVAAVLEVGRAIARLPRAPRRSVILALWDAEEDGLIGAGSYAASPVAPLADTVAYVNFDIVGAAPVRGFRRNTVLVGLDTSPDLAALVASVVGSDPLGVAPLSNIFGQERSDHAVFADQGVPVLFFSDATGGCYHSPGDDPGIVHFGKILRSAWMGSRFVRDLADGAGRPRFSEPGLPLYPDAVALRDLLRRASCELPES
ncbi:MAG: M28 family peptidase, partial [Alphaproteobacteria bacterium]